MDCLVTSARFFYRDASAPAPTHPMNVGVLALIERGGQLLLECRSDAGRWGLIGGGLDADESLEQGPAPPEGRRGKSRCRVRDRL
jgi:8-oxo-dGTP pyrophosphatase MutT (NUDIX family)